MYIKIHTHTHIRMYTFMCMRTYNSTSCNTRTPLLQEEKKTPVYHMMQHTDISCCRKGRKTTTISRHATKQCFLLQAGKYENPRQKLSQKTSEQINALVIFFFGMIDTNMQTWQRCLLLLYSETFMPKMLCMCVADT